MIVGIKMSLRTVRLLRKVVLLEDPRVIVGVPTLV